MRYARCTEDVFKRAVDDVQGWIDLGGAAFGVLRLGEFEHRFGSA